MAQLTLPQTPFPFSTGNVPGSENRTFSINDLPPAVRAAFPGLKAFNKVQVSVAGAVLQTNDSLVVNAPTGSGKTVILELAIVKLALECAPGQFRVIYVAPTRSLCAEKYHDWRARFAGLGISCIQYDGDNAVEDISKLSEHQLILSTPEKWEAFTRHWGDQNVANVLRPIKLFLIDEIQVMDDGVRGATLELVLSRMKYIDSRMHRDQPDADGVPESIRFIAVSACIPNVDDIARWLKNERNVLPFSFAESYRTTRIGRHVVGFPCATNPYKFELDLNYKLPAIIDEHSRQKPTLVFCSSRKSAETTAAFLARSSMRRSLPPAPILSEIAAKIASKHLQDCIVKGIAYHHAGLLHSDRSCVESHFRLGHLAALCCTSTLCMGVNLPAYLVIIKSTYSYAGKDYSDNYILQMMGRAGRAQYDEDGVAVILTTDGSVERYRKLVSGTAPIESQLHHKLPELLNSEVAHGIIYDQPAVVEWVRSTFYHVRAQANPGHYQLSGGRDIGDQIEQLCRETIDSLEESGLILKRRPNTLLPTACGKLMARNHLSFHTMKLLQTEMKGTESLQEMLLLVTKAHEFSEHKCRNNEKRILNSLNAPSTASSAAPERQAGEDSPEGIRFRWPGRISTTGAKVYCLVQAVFGNLTVSDHGLHQEAAKIVTLGARIGRCVVGLLDANGGQLQAGCFRAMVSVTSLIQCFQAKLWENSPFLTKQLSQIGPKLARHLADRGKLTWEAVHDSDPREIEWILKKQPPFGNDLISFVRGLPQFTIELTKTAGADGEEYACTVTQRNGDYDHQAVPVSFSVLVGDTVNRLLLHSGNCTVESITPAGCTWPIYPDINPSVVSLTAHLICLEWVGLDCSHTLHLVDPPVTTKHKQTTITHFFPNQTVANDTMDDEFQIPSAQEIPRGEKVCPVNESFVLSAHFKAKGGALNTSNGNVSTDSGNVSGELFSLASVLNRNAPVHGKTMLNQTSLGNKSFGVSAALNPVRAITSTSANLSSWDVDNTSVAHNSSTLLLQKPIRDVFPLPPFKETNLTVIERLQESTAVTSTNNVSISIGSGNTSTSVLPRPPVGQIFPIRSILKRPLQPEESFSKDPRTLPEQARVEPDSGTVPTKPSIEPQEAPLRIWRQTRPYFPSEDFRHIFRSAKCTQCFTICSPAEDIVECFRKYNVFMPTLAVKRDWRSSFENGRTWSAVSCTQSSSPAGIEEEFPPAVRKRKNIDLGPAEHVFCDCDSD